MRSSQAKRDAAGRRLVRLRLLQPIIEFTHAQAKSGTALIACALLALLLANSPWSDGYRTVLATKIGLHLGANAFERSVHDWINEGLMTLFFLLVGLEIKRELLVGELNSRRQAILPIMAALGGMVIPAAIYLAINVGRASVRGWGVPMATDIAFSLGVLALAGPRVPLSIKVLLTALAIVDDLGAVLVIGIFYTHSVDWAALAVAAGAFITLVGLNLFDVRKLFVYAVIGVVLWAAMLQSGIHATLAGVLLAATIPARTHLDSGEFYKKGKELLAEFDEGGATGSDVILSEHQQGALRAIERACEEVQMPLQRMEHSLHGWVNLLIMPLFALANAGITFSGLSIGKAEWPILLGVGLGLLVGKPLGILGAAWLGIRFRWAQLPSGATWRQVGGAAILGGIGFTMSLFMGSLAYDSPTQLDAAKLGIIAASLIAGLGGFLLLSSQQSTRADD